MPLEDAPTSVAVLVYVLFTVIECLFAMAAGPAAAATGARLAHTSISSRALAVSMLAAVTKAAIYRIMFFIHQFWPNNAYIKLVAGVPVMVAVAEIIVTEVAMLLFHKVPTGLLIGAIPAGFFVGFTYAGEVVAPKTLLEDPQHRANASAVSIVAYIFAALMFVSVSKLHGFYVCTLAIASATAVVYGVVEWFGTKLIANLRNCADQGWEGGDEESELAPRPARALFSPRAPLEEELRPKITDEQLQQTIAAEHEAFDRDVPGYDPVFLSRPPDTNKAVHYVLVVRGHKYQLRNKRKPYFSHHEQATVDLAKGSWSEWDPSRFMVGGYQLMLLGWTRATHDEIVGVGQAIIAVRNQYRVWPKSKHHGNCQHFLRSIADQIVPADKRAPSWNWFRHDRMGPIQLREVDEDATERLESSWRERHD